MNPPMKPFLVVMLCCACSTGNGATSASSSSSGSGAQSSTSSANASSGTALSSSSTSLGPPRTAPVFNEVSARGDDWIELANPANTVLDVGGMVLADSDADGGPRMAEALTFPAGSVVPPGGLLFVVADKAGAMPGVQMDCLVDAGPPACFQAAFGITAAGDTLFLLDEHARVLRSLSVPADVVDGGTWCRHPDSTGEFQDCSPSPGAHNP